MDCRLKKINYIGHYQRMLGYRTLIVTLNQSDTHHFSALFLIKNIIMHTFIQLICQFVLHCTPVYHEVLTKHSFVDICLSFFLP